MALNTTDQINSIDNTDKQKLSKQQILDELSRLGAEPKTLGTLAMLKEVLPVGLKTGADLTAGGIFETAGNLFNNDTLRGMAESKRIDAEETMKTLSPEVQARLDEGYFENGINGTKLALMGAQAIPAFVPVIGAAGKAAAIANASKLGLKYGAVAGQVAGIGTGAVIGGAAGGGNTAQETRQTILNDTVGNVGLTPEQIQTKAQLAAEQSNLESFGVNALGTGISVGLGSLASKAAIKTEAEFAKGALKSATIEGGQGGLKGGLMAAAADLPFNAGQGFAEEAIQAKNTGKDFRMNRAIDNAIGGTITGTAISGGLGSGGKIRSIPLTRESAENRLNFLVKHEGKTAADFQFDEVKPGKFVISDKLVVKDESTTPILNEPVGPIENAVQASKSVDEQFAFNPKQAEDDKAILDAKIEKYNQRKVDYQKEQDTKLISDNEIQTQKGLDESFNKVNENIDKPQNTLPELNSGDKNIDLSAIKEDLPMGTDKPAIDNKNVNKIQENIKVSPEIDQSPPKQIRGFDESKAGDSVKINNKEHVLTDIQAKDWNDLNASHLADKEATKNLQSLSDKAPIYDLKASSDKLNSERRFITGNLKPNEVNELTGNRIESYKRIVSENNKVVSDNSNIIKTDIVPKDLNTITKEVIDDKQARNLEGNPVNNKVIQTREELLDKYTSLSTDKKLFKRSATDFSDQVLIAATPEGDKHIAFGTSLRRIDNTKPIEGLNSFKSTDNFTIKRMPENINADGTPSPHAIGIFKDGKQVAYMADEMARTVSKAIDDGKISDVKAKFFLEPIKSGDGGKRAEAKVITNGEQFRPVLAISGKLDGMVKDFNSIADLKNTDTKYANKRPKAVEEKTTDMGLPDNIAPVVKNIFSTYGDKVNLSIIDNGNIYKSTNSELVNNLKAREGKDFDKIYGLYSHENKEVFVNIDAIKKNMEIKGTLVSKLKLDDAIESTVAHEILGHAALADKFPTMEKLHEFLQNTFDTYPVIKKLLIEQEKTNFINDGFHTNVEEVLANIATNKVIVKEGDNFVIKSFDEIYKNDQKTLNSIVDVLKGSINKLVGREIFSLSSKDKIEINDLRKLMKGIGDDLMSSPNIKSAIDYLDNPNIHPDQKILTFKFSRDPNIVYKTDFINNAIDKMLENISIGLGIAKDFNYSKLGNQSGQAQINEVFNTGYKMNRAYESAAKSYAISISSPIQSIYVALNKGLLGKIGGYLGAVSGPSAIDFKLGNQHLVESDKLNKRFTDTELRAMGGNDASINAYKKAFETYDNGRESSAKSTAYKALLEGSSNFKGDEVNTLLKDLKNIENYDTDSFFLAIDNLISKSDVKDPKILKALNNKLDGIYDLSKADVNTIPRNMINGDYYFVTRDKDGKAIQLDQYTSEVERNIKLKRAKLSLKDGETTEIGNTKNKDTESKQFNEQNAKFSELQNELRQNGVYFNALGNITKYADGIGKKIAGDIHNTELTAYIKTINESHSQEANDLAAMRDYSLKPSNEFVGKLKFLNTIAYLGASISGSIINLFGVTSVIPYAMKYRTAAQSTAMVGKIFAFVSKQSIKDGKNFSTEASKLFQGDRTLVKSLIDRLEKAGILQDHELGDIKDISSNKDVGSKSNNTKTVLINGIMVPMKFTEGINRKTTALTALKIALEDRVKLKLITDEDIINFVHDAVDATQGNYGKGARPSWARNGVGELLYQFKTYPVTQAQTFVSYIKNKNYKSAATMALIWVGLAGSQGIPFMENIDDLIDGLGQSFGYNTQSKQAKENFIKYLAEQAGAGDDVQKTLASIAVYGGFDKLGLPVGLQSRFSSGKIIPGTGALVPSNPNKDKSLFEIAGPLGSTVKAAALGIGRIQDGDIQGGLLQALPSNALRNLVVGIKAGYTGQFNDNKGKKVIDASVGQAIAKAFGFQPKELSNMYRDMENIKSDSEVVKYFKGLVSNRIAKSVVDKDDSARKDAIEFMTAWNKQNPKLSFGVDYSTINRKVTDMVVDSKVRLIKTVDKSVKGDAASLMDNKDE